MTREELIQELAINYEKPEEYFIKMTPIKLLDAWLQYNGVINFTNTIVDIIRITTGIDIRKSITTNAIIIDGEIYNVVPDDGVGCDECAFECFAGEEGICSKLYDIHKHFEKL